MKTYRFEGYSDDTFGEYAITGVDHDDCANSTHRAFRIRSGDESLIVVGVYAPRGTPGGWVIGVQIDDTGDDGGGPLPSWPTRFVPSSRTYSPAFEVDAPDDATCMLLSRSGTQAGE